TGPSHSSVTKDSGSALAPRSTPPYPRTRSATATSRIYVPPVSTAQDFARTMAALPTRFIIRSRRQPHRDRAPCELQSLLTVSRLLAHFAKPTRPARPILSTQLRHFCSIS